MDSVAVSGVGGFCPMGPAPRAAAAGTGSFPPLQPGLGPRQTPIRGVLLTDAELDHTSGLLALRMGASLEVYGTQGVLDALSHSLPLRGILAAFAAIRWITVAAGRTFELSGGLRSQVLPLGGAPPRYVAGAGSRGGWS